MKVPEYRRKDPGDFAAFQDFLVAAAGESEVEPPDIEQLFESDNQQLERLTSLAQRKVTFGDNFNSDAQTIDMIQDVPVRFSPSIKGQPLEALVVKVTDYLSPYMIAWRPTEQAGQVEGVIHWLAAPSEPKAVTWRVWGP